MLSRRKRLRLHRALALVTAALIVNLVLPTPTPTVQAAEIKTPNPKLVSLSPEIVPPPAPVDLPALPVVPDKPRPEAKRHMLVRSSAYSSTPDQTDRDPFTTASGLTVHPGTVAMNCLPIGTKIRIPEYFGDQIFTVEDRMHDRWGCGKIDIWMPTREQAVAWGIPRVHIEILDI